MADTTTDFDIQKAVSQLQEAFSRGDLSEGAVENIRQWLTEPRYAAYAPIVADHLSQGKWRELDDVFWTVIPFGTGGRRGRMYPIGSNAINDRTIGESATGLAQYVKKKLGSQAELSCGIAYDTRHNSRHFAELCAGIMVAEGFKVYFLDDYRSTPELSFLIRHKRCSCGVMVTASHNPPSDNAVKVYWSTGGQLVPPDDSGVIAEVERVEQIEQVEFSQALSDGQIVFCKDEVDAAFVARVAEQSTQGSRELKIIYSPLHGVGASAVCPVLAAARFEDVEVFEPHREPNGDFPNVPEHVSNPENPAVFEAIIQRAKATDADLILATDPDCDRMGCAAPRTTDSSGAWATFNGNQLGAMLADYVLERRRAAGSLSPDHYLVKTLVTTEMIRRIGDSYGVKTYGDLQVGFKWIGEMMDIAGSDKFVLGTEESHGYLVGQYARDKDGAVACMLMAELAAAVKAAGLTLHEKLDALYWQHGYHAERLLHVKMTGSEGMSQMQALMAQFRKDPPHQLAGVQVTAVRDYANLTTTELGGSPVPLEGPQGNMVILDLAEEGNYVAVRPSGTEPKVKFYMFTFVPAELIADLETTKSEMDQRLNRLEADLTAFAKSV